MQDDSESGPEVDAWEIFALAACQPLRGQPGCGVAPRLDPSSVVRALNGYLRPRPDELLLAVVEQTGPAGPGPSCAITSERVYWANPGGSAGSSCPIGELPESVPVSGGLEPTLDLGKGRRIVLRSSGDSGAADALAGVLSSLSRARHSGDLAGSTTPAALHRSRAEIGQVVQQTAALHRIGGEVRSFQADVQTATPRVVVTPVLIASCLAVFAWMVASGVSIMSPSVPDLFAWGGNVGAAVAIDGEDWRLFTSVFLHGGLIHLAINMWVLSRVGPLVERLYGNVGFALLYLAAGVGGSIVSAWWQPLRVSIGASGAIFGLIGGLGAFLVSHRNAIPAQVVARVRGGVVAFVVYNTLFGIAIPGIDNAAHLGGLATGFLAGLFLKRPWPVSRPTAGLARQLLGGLAFASALALLCLAAENRIRKNPEVAALVNPPDPNPLRAYRDFSQQLNPLIRQFDEVHETLKEMRDRVAESDSFDDDDRAEVRALLGQSERVRESLSRIEPDDPDLVAQRDAIAEAQDSLIRALDALGRHLDDPADQETLDGFLRSRDEIDSQARRYLELRQRYFDSRGLAPVPRPEAGPDD